MTGDNKSASTPAVQCDISNKCATEEAESIGPTSPVDSLTAGETSSSQMASSSSSHRKSLNQCHRCKVQIQIKTSMNYVDQADKDVILTVEVYHISL